MVVVLLINAGLIALVIGIALLMTVLKLFDSKLTIPVAIGITAVLVVSITMLTSVNDATWSFPVTPTPGGPTPTPTAAPLPGGPDGFNITGPGSYILTGDVNITTQAIWLQGDNISLDCDGYTITQPAPAPLPCLYSASGNNLLIQGCIITGCSLGIQFQDVTNSEVNGNDIVINLIGVMDSDCTNNTYVYNNINANGDGIEMYSCTDSNIEANTLDDNMGDAIALEDTNYTTITANYMDNNGDDGIELDESFNNDLYYNEVTNSGMDGIYLVDADDNNLYGNFMENATGNGIYLEDSLSNTLDTNTANLCDYGFGFEYTTASNSILNNVVDNSTTYDFKCWDAENQTDAGNNTCGTQDGCVAPPGPADWLTTCPSPTPPPGAPLDACQELSAGIYYLSDDVNVNGSSPCFTFSSGDVVLDCDFHSLYNATGSDTAIAWEDMDNITIEDCDIWGFQTGIDLENSTSFEIYDNQFGDNTYGVWARDSIGLISFNWFINHSNSGILMRNVSNSAVILSYFDNNYYGIHSVDGNGNTYNVNYAMNNTQIAYFFQGENGSVFTENDGDDNGGAGGYGFYLYNTTVNTFANNTILTSTAADFYCEGSPDDNDDTGDNNCTTATTCNWMGTDGGGASTSCGEQTPP